MSVTPIKKSQPKFKVAEFRETALEAKSFELGVDLDLEAGTYDVYGYDDNGDRVLVETVEVADGDVVHVPHPLLLPDERQDAFDKFQRGEDLDQVEITINEETGETRSVPASPRTIDGHEPPGDSYRMAASILGEHELHRLLAGGGRSNDVGLAWQYLTRDNRVTAPKAPKPLR